MKLTSYKIEQRRIAYMYVCQCGNTIYCPAHLLPSIDKCKCGEPWAAVAPKTPTAVPISNPIRLGDYTEKQLKRIGITPERYVAAKALFGLAPTCGCKARKEWLNKISDWWRSEGATQIIA